MAGKTTSSRPWLKGAVLLLPALLMLFAATPADAARRWAVVFGTNYKGSSGQIPPLDLCERDAKLFESSLKNYGNYDEVRVFLGRQVTAKNVQDTLQELASKASADDTIVLYFAGHGSYQRDANAPNGLRNTIVMFERPHLTDDQLNDWLKSIKTTKLLWVFDCCFSGGIVKKGRRGAGNVPITPGQPGKVIENGNDSFYFQNKALVASSDSNETSIEIGGSINQGIFTYWFAQGVNPGNADLNRDQAVTALEAFEWSSRRITQMAEKFNHQQHPQMSGNASGIILAGRITPKPPKPDPKPTPVKPPPPNEDPKPSPVKPEPTPTKPVVPVTPEEPKVVEHPVKSGAQVCTTIFKSRKAGVTSMDPIERIRRSRQADQSRRVRILVSGKDYPSKLSWVNRKQLLRKTGEDIPLGDYTHYGKIFKNKVACVDVSDVPTGVHEIEIRADDYPVIKRRLGIEKNVSENKLFVVASLAGYGTIQGKVFLKNFESPLKGQDIWMPTVNSPNTNFKMRSLSDGSFWFLNLPPDKNYFIKASFLENLPLDSKMLEVKSGAVTRVDIVLSKSLR